ncbi:MAG TPA: cupredoxin family copper-binding protein [Methylophilaceae bacterium]|nr:cupredoxin family copper-binding protein [Methylophilaceae bacterium]
MLPLPRQYGPPARILLMFAALAIGGISSEGRAESTTHTVVIEAMQFTPQVLEVKQGDTVIWVNKDAFPHNATAINGSFRSGDIAPDGSWKFRADKKGGFPYRCTLHPTMKGSLLVK